MKGQPRSCEEREMRDKAITTRNTKVQIRLLHFVSCSTPPNKTKRDKKDIKAFPRELKMYKAKEKVLFLFSQFCKKEPKGARFGLAPLIFWQEEDIDR